MSGDSSPNGLELQQRPRVARLGKWPLYAGIAALFLMIAALVYSVNFAHNEEEKDEKKQVEIKEEEKPIWLVEGSGLAIDPKKDQDSGLIAPPKEQQEPIVIVQQDTRQQERINQELEEMRRLRTQGFISALSAPLAVKKEAHAGANSGNGDSVAQKESDAKNNEVSNVGAAGSDNYYDPAADRDKEAFFNRAKKDLSWELREQRTPGLELELKTGSVVPGVMLTGVNSDLPGNMIAQVSQNVFDTATGRNLLIPQGTKIYGVYDARIVYGQSRVLIAWNRIIFPDGSSMNLGAMPGADMGGMAGFNDQVDNHYFRIFGSAFLMSLVTGSMAYAMDSVNDNIGTEASNGTSMQDEMTSALAAQLGQTSAKLLEKNLNIKPTLEIRPGYQFNIVVTKDVAFKSPYQHWRR